MSKKRNKKSLSVTSQTNTSHTKVKYPRVILTLFFICGLALTVFFLHKKEETPQERSANRQFENMSKVPKEHVHPLLRPVIIGISKTESGNFSSCANGTLLLSRTGKPSRVITSAHVFAPTQYGPSLYFACQVLLPNSKQGETYWFSKVDHDLLRQGSSSNTGESIDDVAVCHIGIPAPIPTTSELTNWKEFWLKGRPVEVTRLKPFKVISVVTGETYEIMSSFLNKNGVLVYGMLYGSESRESGTGFWDGKKTLYITSISALIWPELRKDLGNVPEEHTHITFLSHVDLDFSE